MSPRRGLSLVATTLLLAVMASACRAPQARPGVDLLSQLDGVEFRSDSLDLPFLLSSDALDHAGWREATGPAATPLVWNKRPTAGIRLPFATAAAKELRLRARSHASAGERVELTVTLNGHLLGTLLLAPTEASYRLAIPEAAVMVGDNTLQIAASHANRQAKVFGLSGLDTCPAGVAGPVQAPVLGPAGVRLPGASTLAFLFRYRRGMDLSAAFEAQGEGARVALSFATDAGREQLADAVLRPGRRQVRAALAASGDGFGRLEIGSLGAAPVWLRALRITGPAGEPATPSPAGASLPGRPNLVFFLTDTLRADHLGAYGHKAPTSPRLDAFARESLLFEDAWAQAPWTKPAVASIFTGVTPGSHGVLAFHHALGPALPTLAEAFRAAGYRTAGFCANPVVSENSGYSRGFQKWGNLKGPAASIVARGLDWLDSGQGPFFLYLHTLEPHWPYRPDEEHWAAFRPREYDASQALSALRIRRPEQVALVRSAYEGEVHQNDAAFGSLLDALRQRKLLDDSLVVFTADHGEEIQDHGGVGHATTLYQELLHVPLVVRFPGGRRAGARDTQPLQQIDLLPTLSRLAGLPAPRKAEGRDLSGRWLGGAEDSGPVEMFSELHLVVPDKAAARHGALKLVVNRDYTHNPRPKSRWELFDLGSDPGERRNLAEARPVTAAYLASRIEALRKAQTRGRDPLSAVTLQLSAEDREELKALGYIQ